MVVGAFSAHTAELYEAYRRDLRRVAMVLLSRGCGQGVEDAEGGREVAEIVEAMLLLARTKGVFAETAGGATLAVAKKLIESGMDIKVEDPAKPKGDTKAKVEAKAASTIKKTKSITPDAPAIKAK